MQELSAINWALWASTMIPLTLSAGPGNLMVATSGARSGVRRSFRFIAGLDLTYLVLAFLIGLGLYHALTQNPLVLTVLRSAGSLYILWLGYRLLTRPVETDVSEQDDFNFRDGIITQLANVKGMVMLLVMFSTFVPSEGSSISIIVVLCMALIGLNIVSHLIWVSLGTSLQMILRLCPRLFWMQNFAFGAMLIGVAIWMFMRSTGL